MNKRRVFENVSAATMALAMGTVAWVGVGAIRSEDRFPCRFEDESKIVVVTADGNKSFCLPTDDVTIGVFDQNGNLIEEISIDEHLYRLGIIPRR